MYFRRRPPNPSVKVANLEYAIPHNEAEPRNILEKIVWEKDREVEIARKKISLAKLKSEISKLPKSKNFLDALYKAPTFPAVIAEVKKASPSRGLIRKDFDPVAIAKAYNEGGASCISVLTDKTFFQGGFNVLINVRKAVDLPILCKDFILSPYQIYQARTAGADAILLIAAILTDQDLLYLNKVANSLDLTVLVEVHNSKEFERVLNIGTFPLVGINNRDLTTFQTDIQVTNNLLKKYKSQIEEQGILLVSESGLFTRDDLINVNSAGAGAVLIGEALMRKDDIKSGLKELLGK